VLTTFALYLDIIAISMPSPLAHSISGYVFSKLWFKKRSLRISRKTMNFWLAYTVFITNAPDLDFALQLFSDDKIHRGLLTV